MYESFFSLTQDVSGLIEINVSFVRIKQMLRLSRYMYINCSYHIILVLFKYQTRPIFKKKKKNVFSQKDPHCSLELSL